MNEITFAVLSFIISVFCGLISSYLIPYLKSKTEDSEMQRVTEIIAIAVRAAEQTIKESGQGKSKKAQVLAFVSNWLAENNIHISEEQLDKLLECAVFTMKLEQQ